MSDPVSAKIAQQILDTMRKNSDIYNGITKENPEFLEAIIRNIPLRGLIIFGDIISEEMISRSVQQLNNR